MKLSNASAFLPLIEAAAKGKAIQIMTGGKWLDAEPDANTYFNLAPEKYRIKPEPKTVEFYVMFYSSGGMVLLSKTRFAELIQSRERGPEVVKYQKISVTFEE